MHMNDEVTGQDYPCYFMAEFTKESKFLSHYTMFTFLVARQRCSEECAVY